MRIRLSDIIAHGKHLVWGLQEERGLFARRAYCVAYAIDLCISPHHSETRWEEINAQCIWFYVRVKLRSLTIYCVMCILLFCAVGVGVTAHGRKWSFILVFMLKLSRFGVIAGYFCSDGPFLHQCSFILSSPVITIAELLD